MADPQLREQYTAILRAGYEAAAGEPVSDEHEAEGLRSLLATSEHLADQMEHSIIYAPWTRRDITSLLHTWLEDGAASGTLDLKDLIAPLDDLFGPVRALMIARTETAGVFNGALAAGLRSNGWKQVNWIAAPDACEDCQALADSSPMSIEEFEAESPQHPSCSCTCEPAGEEDVAEGESEVEDAA